MAKLIDFKCNYAEYSGISRDSAAEMGLTLPECYMTAQQIAKLAGQHAVLPFDPVLEAENLGAKIKFDDSSLGPRKEEDIIKKIEQLEDLPPLDVSKGRLAETLKAVKLINESGGDASIEMHGPITIINGLADIMKILMGWRKHPEIMDDFFTLIIKGLSDYALAAREAGAKIIYYTDSPGSLNILGPKYAKQVTENFTLPLLKALDEKLDQDCVIHLCPKTSFLLAGCEKAVWKNLDLGDVMPYKEACEAACGKVRILGQRCRKDRQIKVRNINYLELME